MYLLLALLAVLVAQPAMAQGNDIAGLWRPLARNQDGSGMTGDMAGVPVSDALRWSAESWSPDNFDVAEPFEPRLGGAVTMCPEYIAKMKTMPVPTKTQSGTAESEP